MVWATRFWYGVVSSISPTVAYFFFFIFQIQDKLLSSNNRTEASLGKKLKIDFLPEIEKIHKVFQPSLLMNVMLI